MTAAILERPSIETAGCRFPAWCNGDCIKDDHPSGERNHWSEARSLDAEDMFERVSVQLYGYEERDCVDQVQVHLSMGDDAFDEDGCTLDSSHAREIGAALREFKPEDPQWDDELIWRGRDDAFWFLTIEYRHERCTRRGEDRPGEVVVALRTSSRAHSIRMRLDLRVSRYLGRHLLEAADLADASNKAVPQ